jgi:hypothetical protein
MSRLAAIGTGLSRSNAPLFLGRSRSGEAIPLMESERARHVHVIGSPGTGKSKALEYWIRQDILAGRGVCLLDPHGYLYDDLVAWCAGRRFLGRRRIVLLDASSLAWSFGFSIFFDWTMYAELESPPPAAGSDWDIITLQPDVNLPDDGLYDALALVSGASLSQPFTVTFVWLRQGSPGSQPFAIYDPSFQTIEAGTTVPEPSVLILAMACAALGLPKLWTTRLEKGVRHERIGT